MNRLIPLAVCILMIVGCSTTPQKGKVDEISNINVMTDETPSAAGKKRKKPRKTRTKKTRNISNISKTSTKPSTTTNKNPRARIVKTTVQGVIPFTTTFNGSRSKDWDGSISSYHWDFGDGSSSAETIVNHEFSAEGTYTVTLSVTDDKGGKGSKSIKITALPAPDPTSIESRPVGIYSIDTVVDLPFVAGVAKRFFWSELEPEEGVYDFRGIEQIIHEAELVGQSVTLATLLIDEPSWLMDRISEEDKYEGMQGIDIVPWNETMLQALNKLVQAQSNFEVDGVALKDHPIVKQISASIGTMNGIRMKTIPLNYTPSLLKESVSRSIRYWAKAYPDKHLYIGLFGVNDGTYTSSTTISTTDELKAEILTEFNGINNPRINFFIEFLTGVSPLLDNKNLSGVKDITSIMMQACGSWVSQDYWAHCQWATPMDSPELGINNAMESYSTTYYEIYKEDLQNPDFYNQFEDAAFNVQALADSLE